MSSISSCFRLFTTKIPNSLHPKYLISPKSPNLPFSRSVTFQKIRTQPPSSSASPSGSVPLQPIEELPPKLQEIVKMFQLVQDPRSKYEQLLFYGKNLKPLDAQFKTSQNKVQGCVSQVWVRACLDPDGNVVYEADSDSVLTKGLAALLVLGLSGHPVDEVLRVSPDFVVLLGLQQSLTPSRNNGFLNMLKLMQRKALELVVEAEKCGGSGESSNSESKIDARVEDLNPEVGGQDLEVVSSKTGENGLSESSNLDFESKSESKIDDRMGDLNGGLNPEMGGDDMEIESSKVGESESNSSVLGSRGERIKEKLERELSPVELEVEDISYQHAGHAGARGSDGETHFNVKVVSKEFEGKSLVKRHRVVYNLLQEELQSGLHALSIVAKTPDEVN